MLNLILSEDVFKLEVSMETDINIASHNNAEIVEKVVDKVLNGYDVIDCIPILVEASKHGFKNVSDKIVSEIEKDQDLFYSDDYLKVLEEISKHKNASVAKK